MINTHVRIMSDTHRILANNTDYTVPNSSVLNWWNAGRMDPYWPNLYSSVFNLEGIPYTEKDSKITKTYGAMFCNAFTAPMRNNTREYPYNECNASKSNMTEWNVTN